MRKIRLTEEELVRLMTYIINEAEDKVRLPHYYAPMDNTRVAEKPRREIPKTAQKAAPSQSLPTQQQTPTINKTQMPTMGESEVCKACYKAFRNAGATDGAAKGILANISAESRFNPNIFGWDGNNKSDTFGIGGGLCGFYYHGLLPSLAKHCGWSQDQLDRLNSQVENCGLPRPKVPCSSENSAHIMNLFGDFPFSLEQQVSFIVDNRYFKQVKNINNPSIAAMKWQKLFERPAKVTDRWRENGKNITRLLA